MDSVIVWICEMGSDNPTLATGFAGKSANEIAQSLPGGVYTTIRTYRRKMCFLLERHFDRLEESARILGTNLELDRKAIRLNLRVAINKSSFIENRIRIHIPLIKETAGRIYFMVDSLSTLSSTEYIRGVQTLTERMHRSNALAKATSFISTAEHIRKAMPDGINEILMVSEDQSILEGLSSNFFAIRNKKVCTANEGILNGITREVVIQTIEYLGIPLIFEPVSTNDVSKIDEGFLTSTSRGILPISEIDKEKIGSGFPGPITQQIRRAYEERISSILEEI